MREALEISSKELEITCQYFFSFCSEFIFSNSGSNLKWNTRLKANETEMDASSEGQEVQFSGFFRNLVSWHWMLKVSYFLFLKFYNHEAISIVIKINSIIICPFLLLIAQVFTSNRPELRSNSLNFWDIFFILRCKVEKYIYLWELKIKYLILNLSYMVGTKHMMTTMIITSDINIIICCNLWGICCL